MLAALFSVAIELLLSLFAQYLLHSAAICYAHCAKCQGAAAAIACDRQETNFIACDRQEAVAIACDRQEMLFLSLVTEFNYSDLIRHRDEPRLSGERPLLVVDIRHVLTSLRHQMSR